MPQCNLACGTCAPCAKGTLSELPGSTNKNDCVCKLLNYKQFEGSKGCDYCDLGYFEKADKCETCPKGAKCATKPLTDVVLITATTLSFEGGADAFGATAKAAFASAIVGAMAAGPTGLKVTVAVTDVNVVEGSRRLTERVADAASVLVAYGTYGSALEVMSRNFGLTTETVSAYIGDGLKNLAGFSSTDSTDSTDPQTRRALAASPIKVEYTITVPVEANAGTGVDKAAIAVRKSFNLEPSTHPCLDNLTI